MIKQNDEFVIYPYAYVIKKKDSDNLIDSFVLEFSHETDTVKFYQINYFNKVLCKNLVTFVDREYAEVADDVGTWPLEEAIENGKMMVVAMKETIASAQLAKVDSNNLPMQ